MKAVCGCIRLDATAADPVEVEGMRQALRGSGVAQVENRHDGAAAFAGMRWCPVPQDAPDPTLHVHRETGCMIAADALLLERAELCLALDLPPSSAGTMGDAELILRAYLRWGEDCAAHLPGDFAFVLWDPRTLRAYAARDAMGVRPFYFHHAPGVLLAFASNARAVIASPHVPGGLNEERIGHLLLSQEGVDSRSTFFRAVRRLPPAHWCVIDASGWRETCYWRPGEGRPSVLPDSDGEWTEAVRELLQDAVRSHLQSSVRTGIHIGAMISGGLDSSTIAAIAASQIGAHGVLPVFSAIDSGNPRCPETQAIRSMLADPRFASSCADLARIEELRSALDAAIADSEEPFDAHMTMVHTQYLLAARAGVGAVLDGIDADTVFAEGMRLVHLLRSGQWVVAYREAAGLASFHGGWPAWRQVAAAVPIAFVPGPLKRAVRGVRHRRMRRRSERASLISADFAHRIRSGENRNDDDADSRPDHLGEHANTIRSTWLTGGIERYRRVASAHGIEPRHPFLSRRLLDLCAFLSDRQRTRDGWTKFVLRNAAATLLPPEVCWRRDKEHLGFGFTQALFDLDRQRRLELLGDRRGLLEPYVDLRKLDRFIDRYRRGEGDGIADHLFEAAALQAWLLGLTA